ncbi:MAG: YybH family protein [Nitrosarchaeum sp.]
MSVAFFVSCRDQNQIQNEVSEEQEIKNLMESYKDAIQNLTTEGTFELFTPDAIVFEQGKVEGTYKDYIDNHLGPELKHFESFTFSNYEINITINLPYAYTTENYLYTIVLNEDETEGTSERTIESKGVATSILKKIDNNWRIVHSHTSFKKL